MNSLEERVKTIIVKRLNVREEKISSDSTFIDDFGADSLDTVEVVMAIEEEFEIDICDEEAEKITTFRDLIRLLKARVGHDA